MSSRIYSYHIRIDFDKRRPECSLGNRYSGYPGGKDAAGNEYADSFHFLQDHLVVIATRGSKCEDGSILSNDKNTLYVQMLKALAFYYGYATEIPTIKRVAITRKQLHKPDFVYTEGANFLQPVDSNDIKVNLFSAGVLDILFVNSEKGNAILTALSYWLKSYEYRSIPSLRFDSLWRAFNCLYRYQSNSDKDFTGLTTFKWFIINNPNVFANSLAITDGYSQDIWDSYRWRALILNDYKTQKQAGALKDFVCRYHDSRIMHSLNNIITVREDYLRNAGLWTDVENHINANLATTERIETLTILMLKYAYFVRCKSTHGEVPDNSFKLEHTNMDIEFERLNEVLTIFIFETINNHALLR